MTSPLGDKKLTYGMLQQLIGAARDQASEHPELDVEEYDWLKPYHFNPEQLAMLDVFGKKIESFLTETFTNHCQGEFNTEISSITQQFAHTLAEITPTERQNNFFLPFTFEDKICGFLNIPAQSAVSLVGHMLRDFDNAGEPDRKLSQLEETILLDIAAVIVEALGEAFKDNTDTTVHPANYLVKGEWPLRDADTEHLTTIAFAVEHAQAAIEAEFTILSGALEPIAGIKPKPGPEPSPQALSNMIMQHMHKVPIDVDAQLCSASISLDDVMSLAVGDVVLLDKKTANPLDLLLNHRKCFQAYPATSLGRYAIVVAPPEEE